MIYALKSIASSFDDPPAVTFVLAMVKCLRHFLYIPLLFDLGIMALTALTALDGIYFSPRLSALAALMTLICKNFLNDHFMVNY